jgi:hypothetical protein
MRSEKEVFEGMKQIADFLNRAESTVLKMIRSENLENRKIIWKRRGIWIANRKRLYEWWVEGVDEW